MSPLGSEPRCRRPRIFQAKSKMSASINFTLPWGALPPDIMAKIRGLDCAMRTETEAALAAVRVAQEMLASRAGADCITSKGGRDLVTDADIAAEDAIRQELLRPFP